MTPARRKKDSGPQHSPADGGLASMLENVRLPPGDKRVSHTLLSALELPAPEFIFSAATFLHRLARSLPWVEHEVGMLLGQGDWLSSIEALIEQAKDAGVDSTELMSSTNSRSTLIYRALSARRGPGDRGLEVARGVLLLAAVEIVNPPTIGFLHALASAILGQERFARHPLTSITGLLEPANSASAARRIFADYIEILRPSPGKDSELTDEIFKNLAWLTSEPLPPDPEPEELPQEPRKSDGALPRSRRPGTRPAKVRVVPVDTRSPLGRDEPPEESRAPVTQIKVGGMTRVSPEASVRVDLHSARSHLYRSNANFHIDHISVTADAELERIVPALFERIDSDLARQDRSDVGRGLLTILSLLTGRISTQLAGTLLVDRHRRTLDELSLSLSAGTLRIPVMRPPDAFAPSEVQKPHYEETANFLDLPLPRSVVNRAARLHTELQADRLLEFAYRSRDVSAEYPDGEADDSLEINEEDSRREVRALDASVAAYLSQFIGLPSISCRLSRMRQRFVAQLIQKSGDVAAAMLLTGDSLRDVLSALYYYAPRKQDLSDIYVSAIWPLVKESPVAFRQPDQRIGSQSLPKSASIRAAVQALGGQLSLRKTIEGVTEEQWLARLHRSMVNYSLGMVLTGTLHRPNINLNKLKRWDFDLIHHAVILQDKDIDAAHRVRLVASAPVISEQIGLYLAHLSELARRTGIPASLRLRIGEAVQGTAPLFFFITETTDVDEIEAIDDWLSTLPDVWRALQANWYRTAIAMALREQGVSPAFVLTQAGHLTTAMRPFYPDSCLIPQSFCDAVSAALERILRDQGWKARKGLTVSVDDESVSLPSLRTWQEELQAHAVASQRVKFDVRRRLRMRSRSVREDVTPTVEAELRAVLGERGEQLIEAAQGKPGRKNLPTKKTDAYEVTQEELANIQHRLDQKYDADPVRSTVAHNLLHRLLRRVARLPEWTVPVPGYWLPAPETEPTPFLPSIMLARSQVALLRDHFLKIANPSEGDELYARCFAQLTLFTPYQPSTIRDILRAATRSERTGILPDQTVAEIPDGIHAQGFLLRGLSSVVLGAAAGKKMSADIDDQRLASALQQLMPEWARTSTGDVVQKLESTVSINRILELSPLGRLALGKEGATPAAWPFQRAFLTHGVVTASEEKPQLMPEATPAQSGLKPVTGSDTATSEYRELTEVLYLPKGRKASFVRTGVEIASVNTPAARRAQLAELRALQAELRGPADGYVSILTRLAIDLLENGTEQRVNPKASTVHTYITRLGSKLRILLGSECLSALTADDFADLYESVIEMTEAGEGRHQVPSLCARFHDLLIKDFGAEDFDRSVLGASSAVSRGRVDTRFVSLREYELALEILTKRIDEAVGVAHLQARRQLKIERAILILLKAGGLRSSEAMLLRHKDLLITGDSAVVLVRASRYGWLKSVAGRRLVNIGERLNETELRYLKGFQGEERKRRPSKSVDSFPLFSADDDPSMPVDPAASRRNLIQVLAEVCGRSVRLHGLRHLWLQTQWTPALISNSDPILFTFMGSAERGGGTPRPPSAAVIEIRKVATELGHAVAITSMKNYFHLVFAFSPLLQRYRILNVAEISSASNRSAAANIKLLSRKADHSDDQLATIESLVLDRLFGPAPMFGNSPNLTSSEGASSPLGPLRASGRELEKMLRRVPPSSKDPAQELVAQGLDPITAGTIIKLAEELDARCSYRIFDIRTARDVRVATDRPRQWAVGNPFLVLLDVEPSTEGYQRLQDLTRVFAGAYQVSSPALNIYPSDKALIHGLTQTINPPLQLIITPGSTPSKLCCHFAFSGADTPLMPQLFWTLAVGWIYLHAAQKT